MSDRTDDPNDPASEDNGRDDFTLGELDEDIEEDDWASGPHTDLDDEDLDDEDLDDEDLDDEDLDDEDRDADPPEDDEGREGFWERRIGKKLEGFVPDIVKRALVGGLGPMFMSDDGLRQNLTDLRLPKEAVNFIIQQADNTKREFMRLVAREMRDFLESTNFYDEVAKILTTLSFEIRTQIRLVPNDEAFVRPEIKNSVKVVRDKPKGEEEEPVDEEPVDED